MNGLSLEEERELLELLERFKKDNRIRKPVVVVLTPAQIIIEPDVDELSDLIGFVYNG